MRLTTGLRQSPHSGAGGLARTGPCLASCVLGDPSPLQSTRCRLKGFSSQAATQSQLRLGSAARCQTPSAAGLDRGYFEHFQAQYFSSWEKAYSILQIPWVSFLDQAMHTEACLGLPVLPVKQTGHLNVPPIPSKLCSIRWHRSFAGESNIWLHSLHSWLMPSSARFKWYNLLVTQHISVWDAAASEKRRCRRVQRRGPAAIAVAPLREPAGPLVWSTQVSSTKSHLEPQVTWSFRDTHFQPGWKRGWDQAASSLHTWPGSWRHSAAPPRVLPQRKDIAALGVSYWALPQHLKPEFNHHHWKQAASPLHIHRGRGNYGRRAGAQTSVSLDFPSLNFFQGADRPLQGFKRHFKA